MTELSELDWTLLNLTNDKHFDFVILSLNLSLFLPRWPATKCTVDADDSNDAEDETDPLDYLSSPAEKDPWP